MTLSLATLRADAPAIHVPIRLYPEWWARLSALVVFLGFNLTFFPQLILGYLGMSRRYHAYPEEFKF